MVPGKQLIQPMIPKCRRIVIDLSDVSFIDVLVRSRSGGHLVCCDQGGTTPVMRA
jgi:hypothetical protein